MKISWDFLILILLLFISITVPYRIVYIEKDSGKWKHAYYAIDVFFGVDMLLTFNTSYTESEQMKEVYNRKKIALNYLKGWFIIDFVAIIPFDELL